jgi:hypothetical protein
MQFAGDCGHARVVQAPLTLQLQAHLAERPPPLVFEVVPFGVVDKAKETLRIAGFVPADPTEPRWIPLYWPNK